MMHPANRIVRSNQATPGVEGYVFGGSDGSQMAFWTCSENAVSAEHVHEYDEYMLVVQGCYTLIIEGERIPINPGTRARSTSLQGVQPMLAKWSLERERSMPSVDIAQIGNSHIDECCRLIAIYRSDGLFNARG